VLHILNEDGIRKPTEAVKKQGEGDQGRQRAIEGVNLIKVQYTHM
jgi:hypothetical protein